METTPDNTFGLPPDTYRRALQAHVLPDMDLLKKKAIRPRSPADEISLILEESPTRAVALIMVHKLLRWPFYTQDTFGEVGEHPTCLALAAHLWGDEPLTMAARMYAHEIHGMSVWNPQANRYDTPIRLPAHLKDAPMDEQVKAAKVLWESWLNR